MQANKKKYIYKYNKFGGSQSAEKVLRIYLQLYLKKITENELKNLKKKSKPKIHKNYFCNFVFQTDY